MRCGNNVFRLRASFTVENSIIIPVFTCIIVVMILFALKLHDELILKNAEFRMAVKTEQGQLDSSSDEYRRVLENASDYVKEKTFYSISNKDIIAEDINKKTYVKDNRQPEFIRMVNAAQKLKR